MRVVARSVEHQEIGAEPLLNPMGLGGRIRPVDVARAHDDQRGDADSAEPRLGVPVRLFEQLMYERSLDRSLLTPGSEDRAAAPVIAALRGDTDLAPAHLRVRARDDDPRAGRPLSGRSRPRRRLATRAGRTPGVRAGCSDRG